MTRDNRKRRTWNVARQLSKLASFACQPERLEDRVLLAIDVNTGVFGREPDVAVSPVDPRVVAVGSASDGTLRISADYGATFGETVSFQRPAGLGMYGFSGDPSLGFNATGDMLYWSYLLSLDMDGDGNDEDLSVVIMPIDVSDPTGPVAGTPVDVTPGDMIDDKQWLAVDDDWDSPYVDNIYVSWTRFNNDGSRDILFSRSIDGGVTYSAPRIVSGQEGFVWPSHVETAPNGDVYVGYHTDTCGSPTATIEILRDTTGGADLIAGNPVQKTSFASAVTCNVQTGNPPTAIPQTDFWMQGANGPYIVADPIRPGQIYVVANDDPDNDFSAGDPGDVVVARSTNDGQTWTVNTVSKSPVGTLQVMPTGSIDQNGNFAVFWYDTQGGHVNASNNWLLDVYATVSMDGGLTYSNDFRINDVSFDPDLGATTRFDGPPPTLRIGEYNGIRASNNVAYAAWTGNDGNNHGLFFDMFSIPGAFPDPFEVNDSIPTATILGSLPKVTIQDASLHDQHDVDYYKFTAAHSGKLLTHLFFNNGVADLDLAVFDTEGNLISAATMSQVTPGLDQESFVIPVVGQEEYVIRVRRSTGDDPGNPVEYDLEIENFAAPVPNALWLDPSDDTGMMNNDNVTNEAESRVFIEADLSDFAVMGIDILSPAEVTNGDPGAAVEVIVNGSAVGFATLIAGTNSTLFEYTFEPGELSTTFIPVPGGGGLNAVKAAVRVFDGQDAPANGRTSESAPLLLTLDTAAPNPSEPDMLASSDAGMSSTDNVTSKMNPAFRGTAEANAKVRILANNTIVGQGIVTADGRWEVTVEPLRDGSYQITTEIEDSAGNIGVWPPGGQDPLRIVIDTQVPNTPYLDLLNDTGHSRVDNITSAGLLDFRMIGNDTANGNGNDFPNNVKYRLYWRPGDGSGEVLVYDSFSDFGDFTALGQLEQTVSQALNNPAGAPFPDGLQNFKLEIEDRAGNVGPDFLLAVHVDSTLSLTPTLDLIASSDNGMLSDDDVTNQMQPAFNGLAEADSIIRVYATNVQTGITQLVGEGRAGSDLSDVPPPALIINGVPVNGLPDDDIGVWEVTVEPLTGGTYDLVVESEDWAGNLDQSLPLRVVVDTQIPNTPYLDLLNDTGHSDKDNITSAGLLDFRMIGNDTVNGNGNPQPQDVKYRLYWRPGDGMGEVLVYDSFAEFGDFTELGQLDRTVSQDLNDPGGTPFPDGVQNFKLEIEDRAGNVSPDFLLTVEIDSALSVMPTIDLIASSDSGMQDDDNVTNKMQPAFNGLAEADSIIRVFATNVTTGTTQLVGEGLTGSDLSDVQPPVLVINGIEVDGLPDDDMGVWEVTVEPLTDGVYDIFVESEDWAGNVAQSEPVRLEIDTLEPNTPYLDLIAASDTGRNDEDNVTNDNTLTFTMTTQDPFQNQHLLATNYKFRIFVRPEAAAGGVTGNEILLYDSAVDLTIPAANIMDGLTNLEFLQRQMGTLPDGFHNFKLEVEDRAGNISFDYLLDVVIDTVAPPVPTVQLDPLSDSGVQVDPFTLADRVTFDTDPRFFGTAEADTIVRLASGLIFLGTTVSVPLDGNDAFPAGQYNLATIRDLNDPTAFGTRDGLRSVQATAEDLAGNVSTAATLNLFVDTQGARIVDIRINEPDNPFNLFALKPSTAGPTPLVNALVLLVRDLPPRLAPDFLYDAVVEAIAEDPALYQLVGDHNGIIPIADVTFTQDPDPAISGEPSEGYITLSFDEPLPDDRFSLTVSEKLLDIAGNRLQDVDGGYFLRRFTVDSRPEVGTWAGGSVYLDINGNFIFDPENSDDDVNEDLVYAFATPGDDVFAGNFVLDPAAVADGFDKIAAYGDVSHPSSSTGFRWKIDLDHDGVADLDQPDAANINGLPVAGRFDNSDTNGDEVGLFTGKTWYFDTNHDFQVDFSFASQLRGYPMVGDFNGDGFDDLGTYNEQLDRFEFDLTTGTRGSWDGVVDRVASFGFAGVRERPVAADMDQDGIDDFGLWVPDRSGVTPGEAGEWFIFVSGGESILDRIAINPDDGLASLMFRTDPFGNDIFAQFGDEFALPVLGNFDPPLKGHSAWTNLFNALDVNRDTEVAPLDALLVINQLGRSLPARNTEDMYYDVDSNGLVTALDALLVINDLNHMTPQAPHSATAGRDVGKSPSPHGGLPFTMEVPNTVPPGWSGQRAWQDRDDGPVEVALRDIAADIARTWA